MGPHFEDDYIDTLPDVKAPPSHYNFPIQPLDYIEQNELGFHEGNIVKYVTRYRRKGGIADLEKALDYLQRLIKIEDARIPF